jgi:hypothetical protein
MRLEIISFKMVKNIACTIMLIYEALIFGEPGMAL